jgi:hypothetical protein
VGWGGGEVGMEVGIGEKRQSGQGVVQVVRHEEDVEECKQVGFVLLWRVCLGVM